MQPHSDQHATARGSGGKISFIFPPGGFRFLSPCRKEQRDSNELLGDVLISIMSCTVTRFLPHPLRGSSLPEGAYARVNVAGLSRPPGTPIVGFRRVERNNATHTNSLGMLSLPYSLSYGQPRPNRLS